MARIFAASITGTTGTTLPFVVNLHNAPTNIGVAVYQANDTGMYIVQHTFDSPFDRKIDGNLRWADVTAFTSGARWNNHATLTSLTSTADGNYAFPPAAIRLNVVSAAATTNFEIRIIQSGIAGN